MSQDEADVEEAALQRLAWGAWSWHAASQCRLGTWVARVGWVELWLVPLVGICIMGLGLIPIGFRRFKVQWTMLGCPRVQKVQGTMGHT